MLSNVVCIMRLSKLNATYFVLEEFTWRPIECHVDSTHYVADHDELKATELCISCRDSTLAVANSSTV